MKICAKFLVLPAMILGGVLLAGAPEKVFGLTYSQDIDVSFTFNSGLKMSVSANNLSVYDLAPGTASDSNVVTINVITNSMNGYTLNASVGNNALYDTRDLVFNNSVGSGTSSSVFSSLDYGSSVSSLGAFGEGTWGYSYLDGSLNNGANTTWANYSGLPLYSDTTNIATLKATTGPQADASGDDIKFKIGAKSSTAQTAGEYNNVINFTLVAAPVSN